jgi:hypothetical protein
MTISSPPIATLASVLVRYNASVEGSNRKGISNGAQEAVERFKGGLIPSASGVSNE